MLHTGDLARLCNWIRSLPEETLQGKLELAIYAGWAYALAAQIVDAQVWLERAEAFVSTNTSPISRGRLLGLAAYLAAERQNPEETLRLAQVGLEFLGKGDPFFRSLVLRTLAHPLQVTGNINGAIDALQEAVSLSRDASHPLADIPAISSLGLQLFWGGQRMKALDLCHQALKQFVDSHSVPLPLAGILYYLLATLLYEGNELVEAQAALNLGMKLTQPLGLLGVDLTGKQVQAWLLAADGDLEAAMAIVEDGQNTAVQGDLPGFVSYFSAVEAGLHLRRGELAAARRWQESACLPLVSPLDPSLDTEYFALARVYLAFKRLDETKRLLTDLEQALRSAGRWGRIITVYLLQARLHLEQGQSVAATQALEHALIIGEPEGFVRAFVDEGEPIRLLLLDCQSLIKKKIRDGADGETIRLLTYTDKLLAAFSQTAPGMESKSDSMIDPLSERELEILSLIATGRSNREIADILVITVSTVKTHINRLYSKLGAQRRTQAILIAREQGLLSD
jgi:LuxR family maltose regulon positive regulatory protein